MTFAPEASEAVAEESPLGRLRLEQGVGVPLHEQVRKGLREIISLHFQPGALFYSEKTLMEKLPVSRITVRRALHDLQREGLLHRQAGHGTRVLDLMPADAPRATPAGPRRASRRTVGILVMSYTSEYVSAMLERVSLACQARDLALQTYFCREGTRSEEAIEHFARGPDEEAFLLLTPLDATLDLYHSLTGRGFRVVALDGVPSRFPGSTVVTDSQAAVRVGMEHLRGLGHERIVFLVNEPLRDTSVLDKVEEFQRLHREFGSPAVSRVVLCGTHFGESSFGAATAHMAEVWDVAPALRPTAIMTASDPGAWAALRWLAERGVSVPGQVSVLGFEDAASSRFMHPALSSVAHPLAERAERALELLWGEPTLGPQHIRLAPALVARDSTGPAPADTLILPALAAP